MALMLRRMRGISRDFSHIYSDYLQFWQDTGFFASHRNTLPHAWKNIKRSFTNTGYFVKRVSTAASETSHEFLSEDNLLTFIESSLNDLKGPHHCWINKVEDNKDFLKRNGVFLILFGAFLKEPLVLDDNAVMFEKVKSLQQRYPPLHVMGFQSSSSIFSDAVRTRFVQITMKHYITFPILLSNKNFTEMPDRAYFGVFKGFQSSLTCYESDVNLETIDKAIKELMQHVENHEKRIGVKSPWAKQIEVIKQPHDCSFLHDLLLYFPGCISVDEIGNHLFLSDINHHRIIIFDDNGKISDCIGSSPGFEDGEFESAKLMCPAASFYHATDGCLYFVDSENHAVRRANMERRVVETLYPTSNANKKDNSFWSRIMTNLLMKRAVDTTSEYLSSESFLFPWHLIKSLDDDLFIANRSFETLWIMDLASGVIKEVVKEFPKIMEICGELILEKSSLLKHIPGDWLQQLVGTHCPHQDIIYASVMSSLARFQDDIAICDTVGQRVLRLNRESGCISSFQFSNFGILGLPYWVSSSLERVYTVGEASSGRIDHVQCFNLLPGRVDIQLNISIPEGTDLAEPLQEGCVWRQARGAAIDVSGAENTTATSLEKVGVSQQWYDELDNLAFSEQESESIADEESTCDDNLQEGGGVCIDCAIKTSPGTSEVIIHAALYLKLKQDPNSCKEKNTARIADILNTNSTKDQCVQFLMKSDSLEEIVFMKPLCVKIKIDCRDHPKADNSKDIILTDSSIDVNVYIK